MEKNDEKAPSGFPEWLKNLLKTLLKAFLAFAIVGYLIRSHSDDLLKTFRAINLWWIIPAFIFYALHIFANAWRWHLLLKAQKIDCSLMTANSLTMQSFFFSLVMPGGAIGGDVVRAGFLSARVPKGRKFDGIFTILIDRFTGMIGIFLVAILMLPFTWWCISAGGGILDSVIYALLIGSFIGILASVAVFKHRYFERFRLFRAFRDFADRFSHGLFTKVEDALDSYQDCKKELAICVAASVVFVNLNLALVAYFITLSVVGSQAVFTAALAAITIGNIAGLFTPTPSGVGGRDIFVCAILVASGLTDAQAMAVTLSITILIILFNMLGGFFFIFDKPAKTDGVHETP